MKWNLKLFKKREKFNYTEQLLQLLITQFEQIKTSSTESDDIIMINNIIKGLVLRYGLATGKIAYDRSIKSITNRLPEMTDEQKQLSDKCFYYIDKIMFRIGDIPHK